MLHGAIVWLVGVPLLLMLAALGAGSFFGGWYSGLAGTPAWGAQAAAPYDRSANAGCRRHCARSGPICNR